MRSSYNYTVILGFPDLGHGVDGVATNYNGKCWRRLPRDYQFSFVRVELRCFLVRRQLTIVPVLRTEAPTGELDWESYADARELSSCVGC